MIVEGVEFLERAEDGSMSPVTMGAVGDGMETDAAGRLYVTDGEHNAVHRRLPDRRRPDRTVLIEPLVDLPVIPSSRRGTRAAPD
jgi:sugar lactone lactonase YvrE